MPFSKSSRVKLNRVKQPGGTIGNCCTPGVVQQVLLARECAMSPFFQIFGGLSVFCLTPLSITPVVVDLAI
jgi:hypothetical protein